MSRSSTVSAATDSLDKYSAFEPNDPRIPSAELETEESHAGLDDHLEPGGKVLLAYGCVDAIKTIRKLAKENGLAFNIRDTRELDDLPEEFLPGMLLEIER